jgi:hypothetical protein
MRMRGAGRKSCGIAAAAILSAVLVGTPSFGAVSPHGTPATPSNVTLVSGPKTIIATWTESSSGAIRYRVTASSPGRAAKTCATKKLTCTLTALVAGAIYGVTVTATNASGTSAPSIPATTPVDVPGAPLSVHVTADVAAATVSWSAPKASTVSAVTGYVATASPGGYTCATADTLIAKSARACGIAGLTPGTIYEVTVSAINAYGSGPPSAAVSVTAG